MLLILFGCDQSNEPPSGPTYKNTSIVNEQIFHLAIHPLHNPKKLSEAYQPLIDYLNKEIPDITFKLEASRDYQAYEVKFRNRKPELLLPNPWQTLEAIKVDYNVIAMAGDAEDFKGIFIVRKDSGIDKPTDLKGKVVSYPSHTALAACIMPQRYLHDNGVNIKTDITNRYVGSQESSIMNALLGEAAAGATWPPPWRLFKRDRPEDAKKLKVIWETPSLMNNSVMVRNDISIEIKNRIQQLLIQLHKMKGSQTILKGMETARFYPANNDSYMPVQEFVNQFEADIRLVEKP